MPRMHLPHQDVSKKIRPKIRGLVHYLPELFPKPNANGAQSATLCAMAYRAGATETWLRIGTTAQRCDFTLTDPARAELPFPTGPKRS